MGLLSIFQRNKQAAATPTTPGRAGRTSARRAATGNAVNSTGSLSPAEAAEAVRDARARARRRLMGATVLLLVGVIGFPLLFETQPRPIPVDLPIEIPARNAAGGVDPTPRHAGSRAGAGAQALAAVAPSSGIAPESVSYDARQSASAPPANAADRTPAAPPSVPAPARSAFASLAAALTPGLLRSGDAASASTGPPTPASALGRASSRSLPPQARTASATARNPAVSTPMAMPPPTPMPVATTTTTTTPRASSPAQPVPQPAPAAAPGPESTSEASATSPAASRPGDASTSVIRYVVQVAAFADDSKLREARAKVERFGLKTYTQSVDTPAGKRVRLRVGPYATKAEADKAAARIKAGSLPAAVLTL